MKCVPWIVAPTIALLLVGCSAPPKAPEPASSAPAPVAGKKLVFAFQKQSEPGKIQETAKKVADRLSKDLGVPTEVLVPSAYSATVQALIGDQAQIAYLSSIPYLLAQRETKMEILLAEERGGRLDYDSILVVRADSPFTDLASLKGKRMAFTSSTSTSGYVMPFAHFIEKGLIPEKGNPDNYFGRVFFAGAYDKALRAVLDGSADVAAVSDYTMEGERADIYLNATERAKLKVIYRIPGVPTHLIAVRADLPAEQKTKIRETLLALAKEDPKVFADLYGAATFVAVPGDSHVDKAREALAKTGLSPETLVP